MNVKTMRKAVPALAAALGLFAFATPSAFANWQSDAYFGAEVEEGEEVLTNGDWTENSPTVDTENNLFVIDSTQTVFSVGEGFDDLTKHKRVYVECDLNFNDYYYLDDITNDVTSAIAALSLVTNETTGATSWYAVTGGNEWIPVSAADFPTTVGNYKSQIVLDYENREQPTVQYLVCLADGNDWKTLQDKDGNESFLSAENALILSNVCFCGKAELKKMVSFLSTDAVAKIGDTEYEDIYTALSVASGSGETIDLLASVEIDGAELGSYAGDSGSTFNFNENGNKVTLIQATWTSSDKIGYDVTYADSQLCVSEDLYLVAQIEDTRYTSLQAAADASKDGDTITVVAVDGLDTIEFDDTLMITNAVTLDLNDQTIEKVEGTGTWAIQFTKDLEIKNGYLNANSNGVCNAEEGQEAGLKIYSVSMTAGGRAIQLSNKGYNPVNGPGAFYIDEQTSIESEGIGIICGNGDRDHARAVTIDGTVEANLRALQLSGNNTAVIGETAELSTSDDDIAVYYGGTWYNNGNGNPGTRPTLTHNGKITLNSSTEGIPAFYTDPGDEIGVNLTMNYEEANISADGTGAAFELNVQGTIDITDGEFSGSITSTTVKKFLKGGDYYYVEPTKDVIAKGYVTELVNEDIPKWTIVEGGEQGAVAVVTNGGATTNYVDTIEAAIASEGVEEVILCQDFTNDAQIVINKAIVFNLDEYTLTFSDSVSGYGVKVTADGATVKNGTIATDFTGYKTGFQALCFNRCGGTAKDLTLNIPNADYGVIAECDGSSPYETNREDLPYINCENVNVTGNGALFYAEAANMSLDENCGATWTASEDTPADHRCAIYSTYNALITVVGGTYDATGANAFHFGNYATSVKVYGGTFIGDLWNSTGNEHADLYPAEYQATLEITGGSFTGAFIQPETPSPKQVWAIKGGTFTSDPAEYMADGYYAVPGDESWEVTNSGLVAAVGKHGFVTLEDATVAAAGERDVTLLANAELATLANAAAIDMNGKNLSITGDTLDYNLTVRDRTGSDSRLSAEGTKYINADLDLSPLAYKQIAGHTGVFVIASGCTVLLNVDESVKDLAKTGMFDGSAVGAMVVTNDGEATFDGVLWLAEGETAFAGAGTLEDPYLIQSKDDLLNLKAYAKQTNYTDKCFKQTVDIDLAGIEWDAIGTNMHTDDTTTGEGFFKGVYDGGNKSITNLRFASAKYVGFFGGLYEAAVSNLTITTTGASSGVEDYCAAVISGVAYSTVIENVTVNGEIDCAYNVAGFITKAKNTTFIDCTNNANLRTSVKRASGFVAYEIGFTGNTLTFIRCTNNGNITGALTESADYGAGAFLGGLSDSHVTFTDCSNTGVIANTNGLGEVVTTRAGQFIGLIQLGYGKKVGVAATGCVVRDDMRVIDIVDTDAAMSGIFFATVDGGVATLCEPALGGSYKVMTPGAAFNFTEAGTITLDETLATATVTAADHYTVTKEGNVYTCAATGHNITYVYTTNSVSVAAEELVGLANDAQKTFTEVEDVEIETNKISLAGFKVVGAEPSGWTAGDYEADVEVTIAFEKVESGTKVAPGGSPVDVEAESAEAATNGVEVVVSSPDETIVSDEDYKDYFYVKATDLGGGSYRLTAELKPEITQAADETEQIADGLGDIAAGEASSIQIENAKPGLWYSVIYSDSVSSMTGSMVGALEGDRAQAQADGSVTVNMPKKGDEPTQQFYQVQVNTSDKGTVQ